jgi:hypothetical protein
MIKIGEQRCCNSGWPKAKDIGEHAGEVDLLVAVGAPEIGRWSVD